MRMRLQPPADEAVTDVVGSILLVAMTILMSAALGFMLLAFVGPAHTTHAQLAVSIHPGANGWGTGDEQVRITHRGGDPLQADQMRVAMRIGGNVVTLSGAALGSAWSDGKLTIGERWAHTATIQSGAAVSVNIIRFGDGSQLLGKESLVAGAVSTSLPCQLDTMPPTVLLWNQVPGTVTATYTGPVSVTVQLTDNCWGVNPAAVPNLFWRIGTSGPFTDTGAMTSAGTARWAGSFGGASQTWTTGQTLQYKVGPLVDLGGNSGDSSVQSTVVQADCSQDNVPPNVVQITQAPADVRSNTVGAVNVTLQATDNCAGIDAANPPILKYRVNDGSNPAYTTAAPLVATVANPCCTWRGTIPNPGWPSQAGKTLNHFFEGMRDLNGNSANSAVTNDFIDPIYTDTFVNSGTAVTGTLTAFNNAKSATDSGAEAVLTEFGTVQSTQTQTYFAEAVVLSNQWGTPNNVFASDDLHATYAINCANGPCADVLKVDIQDPPASSGAISRVAIFAEVSITGYSNDGFQLAACLAGGSCSQYSSTLGGSAADAIITYDVTALRPGNPGGAWSWTDIVNLQPTLIATQTGSRDGTWRVDRIWIEVNSQVTHNALNVRFEWTGVPAGAGSRLLDLQYRVTGDTFRVEVCQNAANPCGSWLARGATLNAATATNWQYTLTAAEYNSGAPRIRFIDSMPTGTVQGNLYVDWARVRTV